MLKKIKQEESTTPIGTYERYSRYNFDGLLISNSYSENQTSRTYLQIFHNGSIEAVSEIDTRTRKLIPSVWYERELIDAVNRYLFLLQKLEVQPPFVVLLSLTGVKGFKMAVDSYRHSFEGQPIDRDVLINPEIIIEQFEGEKSQILRPIFDMVWNAAGWPRSMNYDENGEWNQKE